MQTTSKVLMVKPARFAFNPQTGGNNAFSRPGRESSAQENALREFTSYVALLRANKIDVVIAEDTPHPHTPDSIFPNNWFSTHEDGTLVLYPMSAPNRRNERKPEVLEVIRKNFEVRRLIDLTWWENDNLFLEGTGSMILDRDNRVVYACKSYRTSEQVLADFCKQMSYTPQRCRRLPYERADEPRHRLLHHLHRVHPPGGPGESPEFHHRQRQEDNGYLI